MSADAPVLAATHWKSNADLILDVVELGYLRYEDHVLDPTYGKGTWWKKWYPKLLTFHTPRVVGASIDFRDMSRYADDTFDVVAFDPPYVSVGGRKTTGIADMHDAYGLTDAPTSPWGVQHLINDGLRECNRVAKRVVLVKCQDYISSGKFWPGSFYTQRFACDVLGMEVLDRFVHVTHPRPQPPRAKQHHARNNLSVLFVFKPTR